MMKNFLALALVASLAACSSAPKDTYEKRVYEERIQQEKSVERSIDKAPKWMTELPESKNAVFANGSSVSRDMSMADWKAKMVAMGKICVAAGGQISQQGKIFMQDSESTSIEISEMAIKTFCVVTMFLWVRATFPRYRYDQLMRLGWKIFIPVTLVWLVVIAIWMQTPWNIWN